MKRFLSLVLAFVFMLGLLPVVPAKDVSASNGTVLHVEADVGWDAATQTVVIAD